MPHIGGHVSAAGGLSPAFERGEAIGAECIQIFGASPRTWKTRIPDETVITAFREAHATSRIDEVFLHASYLVNLGSPNNRIFYGSISNLSTHFEICNALKADGLVFHIGSWKDTTREEGIANVVRGMKKVLEQVSGDSLLLMENSAGGGNKIGVEIEEIGEIFHQLDDPRVKVCIDTQHAFAGGQIEYTKAGVADFAARCEAAFGLENIVVLHVNDSKSEYASHVDRHENIGEGHIGLKGFEHLAAHSFFATIPWCLEVPGMEGNGPDIENIERVRKFFV